MAQMHMANAFDPESAPEVPARTAELLTRREAVLSASYRLFYREPVEVVRAEGAWLYDSAGRPHLDMYNNVPAIGHSHPAVTEAVTRQLGRLNTHTRYLTEGILDYSEALLKTFPAALDQVTYACSGSEAVDLAVRMARFATGREGIIISAHAYHGTTALAASLSPSLGVNNPIAEAVAIVDMRPGMDVETVAAEVRAAAADLEARGHGVAAVIFDSIFSSDGVLPEPVGGLAAAADVARAFGGCVIADEVQPGFGRTGTMWGFSRHGMEPDLVVLGKPMGNGMPISAVVSRREISDEFGASVRYFNTFGGNPVCIAAAQAVLDVVTGSLLARHAEQLGQVLADGLAVRAGRTDLLGDVRAAGLFVGVDVRGSAARPPAEAAAAIVNGLRQRRVLISASGPGADVLKIRPPLVFDEAEAEVFFTALDDTLHELS